MKTSSQLKWNNANPEKLKESSRLYREKNREILRIKNREWYSKNSKKGIEASSRWSKNNPDKRVIYRKNSRETSRLYENKKYKEDINYKLSCILRSRLNEKLSKHINNYNTRISSTKYLGCSVEELKIHIEKSFEEGMTWDNWSFSGWHIDHIMPFGAFDLTNEENIKKICHYSNLRPMWGVENMSKGKKLIEKL